MYDKKNVVIPFSTTETQRTRLNNLSVKLKINRSWLIRTLVKYALKNLNNDQIRELADHDINSGSRKSLK